MRRRKRTDFVVVHCSATPPSMDIGRDEIDDWHRQRGWAGIGYHYVIRRNGDVEIGRPVNMMGSHVRGYNAESVAVCWVGGVDADGVPEDNRTEMQKLSLRAIVAMLMATYPEATLRGHRDFPGVLKACPSFDVEEWWAGILAVAHQTG